MAVQSPVKMSILDDLDDDDDQPICFKRTSQSSKQNQAKTEVKKPSSLPHDGQPRVHNSNGQSSNSQKAKMAQPSRPPSRLPPPSSLKSPVASPKPLTLSGKVSPPMSRPPNPKISSSPANPKISSSPSPVNPKRSPSPVNPKRSPSPVNPKRSPSPVNPKRSPSPVNPKASPSPIAKHSSRESTPITKEEPGSDSDDNKPLSTRQFSFSNNTKGAGPSNQSHSKKMASVKASADDSDDEKPIASKYARKSDVGTSVSKPNASSKILQNGLAFREDDKKPSMMSSKRPLDKSVSSGQPPVKKPKVSDTVPATKPKLSAKPEPDDEDDDDHVPISQRIKKTPVATPANKSSSSKAKLKTAAPQKFKKTAKDAKKSQYPMSTKMLPSGDGQKKWTTLVHSGVIFPPPYKSHGVKMLYNGKPVDLTQEQEEVATMYAMMKDTEYMQKDKFKENFWNDWKKILGSKHVIQKLDLCDFTPIYDWYQEEKEKKKNMTKEEKNALKEEKLKLEEKYMWAIVDGVKEKVGNFRVEPPGLFRGRGEHPKMGKLKKRIRPGDITINIGKGAPVPECPVPGQKWKEVRHDNTVTWLAYWNDPINPKELKYVFLAASSSLKGQSDKEKYEKARLLKTYIKNIRAAYEKDFTNKNAAKKQIAVATYLIDKLALRAGNEKDEDEADTVGCCTLKVENVKAISPNSLEFNFLGKDSIRYENTVEVELPVYKAILQFQAGKKPDDPLFDELDTSKLNAHLKELMPGLTAKVFRTYNASITLDDMLNKETKEGDVAAKILVYQRANKEVAIICNHQRSVSKSHAAQMTKLTEKIDELKESMEELKVDLERARKGKPPLKDAEGKTKRNLSPEAIEKKMNQTQAKIDKMERDKHTKDDLKTVALGTSKINYLDPRITVAWCKRHDVPIEKIFNKSLLGKFAWAMDVEPDFRF